MKPVALALIVLAVVVVLALVGWLVIRWVGQRAGVRQAEFKAMARAVADIEAKTDLYRDLDSPLATEVRQILRQLNKSRMERF